ncbi:MAG: ribose-phosphate pyrophosphokinase-like domain-containing protein, partial [Candidatus Baltobacteraceae bacterium]
MKHLSTRPLRRRFRSTSGRRPGRVDPEQARNRSFSAGRVLRARSIGASTKVFMRGLREPQDSALGHLREVPLSHNSLVFSGNSNRALAQEIATKLKVHIGKALVSEFKNEETRV